MEGARKWNQLGHIAKHRNNSGVVRMAAKSNGRTTSLDVIDPVFILCQWALPHHSASLWANIEPKQLCKWLDFKKFPFWQVLCNPTASFCMNLLRKKHKTGQEHTLVVLVQDLHGICNH